MDFYKTNGVKFLWIGLFPACLKQKESGLFCKKLINKCIICGSLEQPDNVQQEKSTPDGYRYFSCLRASSLLIGSYNADEPYFYFMYEKAYY